MKNSIVSFLILSLLGGVSFEALCAPVSLLPGGGKPPLEKLSEVSSLPPEDQDVAIGPQAPWDGTPAALMERFGSQLTLRPQSPLMRSLILDLLKRPLKEEAPRKVWVDRLMGLGDFEAPLTLMPLEKTAETQKLTLDRLWLSGAWEKACAQVTDRIQKEGAAGLQSAQVFCQYLAKETEKARISAELMGELGAEMDTLPLIRFMLGETAVLDLSPKGSLLPLEMAILAQGTRSFSLEGLPLSGLRLVGNSKTLPADRRMDGAQRAALGGFFEGKALAELYREASDAPLAQTFREAQNSADDESRAFAIVQLWREASEKRLLPVAALLIGALSEAHPDLQKQSWVHPYLWRSAFLNGKPPLSSPQPAAGRLAPLFFFQNPETYAFDLAAWQQTMVDEKDLKTPLLSYLVREFLGRMGRPKGSPLLDEPPTPSWRHHFGVDPSLWELLTAASTSGRAEETLLLGLVILDDGDLTLLDPNRILRVFEAFWRVGLKRQALDLALQTLILKGL